MTEDEAKAKWCPFVRAVVGKIKPDGSSEFAVPNVVHNRVVDGTRWATATGAACIGSGCMAWRWDVTPQQAESNRERQAALEAKGEWFVSMVEVGRCGLAGD